MKKLITLLLASGFFAISFAQSDYIKQPALSVAFAFNDFGTASTLRNGGLSKVLGTKEWKRTKNMNPSLAISYLKGLSNTVDLAITGSGCFIDYPIPGKVLTGSDKILLEAAATANVKLFSDKYAFSPFITVGAGVSKYKGYYGAFAPIGLGLQVNLINEAFLLFNTQYRVPLTSNAAYHLYHSIGIAGNISTRKK